MIDGTNVLINFSKITKKYIKTAFNETIMFSVYYNECKSKKKRCTKETETSGL